MREIFAFATIVLCVGFGNEAAAEQSRYSEALQQACMADYKKLCGEYGIETAALRTTCMDKNGHSLTKTCLNALIDAGEVSQAEVDRRKKSGINFAAVTAMGTSVLALANSVTWEARDGMVTYVQRD